MDGFEEKKWFVYLGDHHEGPFSLAEIETKLLESQVSTSSYIWSDGMEDWALMRDVPVFGGLLARLKNDRTPSISLEIESSTPPKVEPIKIPERELTGPIMSIENAPSLDLNKKHLLRDPSKKPELPYVVNKRGVAKRLLPWVFFLLVIGGAGFSFQAGYVNLDTPIVRSALQSAQGWIGPLAVDYSTKFPVLLDLLSPFPAPADLAHDQLRELKAAALTPIQSGPVLATAVGGGAVTPTLYLATNLPSGSRFDLHLEGVTETLLDRFRAKVDSVITVQEHLGKTDPLKLDANTTLPTGEYLVQVSDSSNQLSVRKSIFIGAARDAAYEGRLREFHAKIREKAALEITELKQIFGTIENGLDLTQKRFEEAKKNTAARKRVWPRFRNEWQALTKPMSETFTKWAAGISAGDLYFDGLYRDTQLAGEALIRLNSLQGETLEGKGDRKSLEIQLGEAASVTQSSIQSLKTRLEAAEKSAADSNGLPKREGL